MKKILMIKPESRPSETELDSLNKRIKESIKDGYILLSSCYYTYEIVEIDDVVVEK